MDDDLTLLGLADQIKERPPCIVWPENALTVRVFFNLGYQWRELMTMDGARPQGLDHGQIKSTLQLMCVKKKMWPELFDGLKTMEAEALKIINGEN